MDGVQLLRLGKRLTDLGRDVVADPSGGTLTPGELAVIGDVFKHPGASVQDIRARTGFAQSHVSTSVQRLRDRGILLAAPDPADGRRTLLTLADQVRRVVHQRAAMPAEQVLSAALSDPGQTARAVALIGELARLLGIPPTEPPAAER
ncbi:MarR family winged helix-turn-helix transcriptional regulator [Streptomyces andamanensis]|uniref:MarR family winged helix-turn-helix transcriptional regulator n=1 Tax=Streptomyces andamanensis TaxID=1565035 RepID=A0ABV8TJP5_9ACTN